MSRLARPLDDPWGDWDYCRMYDSIQSLGRERERAEKQFEMLKALREQWLSESKQKESAQ